jgi:Lrp/AsnC family leucine-responsive transcriptional regulator
VEIKVDKRDRRVLFELDKNCRVPLTTLAKRLKMPIETLRYRIQRLTDSGIIKNYLTVIDGGRLGFYYYKVFLRLHNTSEVGLRRIVQSLVQNPRICWVVRVDGAFDIGFTPRVESPLEQSQLLNELRSKYADSIQSCTLSVNVKMDFLSRDYLVQATKRASALGSYSAQNKIYQLDDLEQKVLDGLAANPRTSGAELAKILGVSTETVLTRIRRLEREQVIVRYMTVVDNEVLGQINYYVLVHFSKLAFDREAAFVKFCSTHPNVVYFIKALGPWDYELSIEVDSVRAGRDFMMLMNREFADIIREYNALMVYEINKYTYP